MATPAQTPIQYEVRIADADRHLFAVRLRIPAPASRQRVSLPAWIPGSYLIREFARNLDGLRASRGAAPDGLRQLDKCTWEVETRPGRALTLEYRIRAFDPSVRAAWLDRQRAFFNGTSLLLRVHGQEDQAHELFIPRPQGFPRWHLATAMEPLRCDDRGFGRYRAADYDELVDHPVEMGAFWSGCFEVRGLAHRFVVAGAPPAFDGERLLQDTAAICEAQMAFWHGDQPAQHAPYLFLLNATSDGYGGIEHRASTALVCARRDLPRHTGHGANGASQRAYQTLLGVISHEYFHAWNIKRIKPVEFVPYDYRRENHTELLWFFEGFTSYYDDMLLHRAGLIDEAAYLKRLSKVINQTLQAPGRHVQSVAQASFDAWTRFYRPDANTPNSTISYYAKGALVALCLDLSLRSERRGTLDDVMRLLWQRHKDQPLAQADVEAALKQVSGRSWSAELQAWVHGTGELPLQPLLEASGIAVAHEPAPLAQALGLRLEKGPGIRLKVVLDDGPAADAGMAAGDEWLGLLDPAAPRTSKAGWRLGNLAELPLYAAAGTTVQALVARDGHLLRLPLRMPEGCTAWHLRRDPTAGDEPAWPAR